MPPADKGVTGRGQAAGELHLGEAHKAGCPVVLIKNGLAVFLEVHVGVYGDDQHQPVDDVLPG
jgi:hypothetical protein